jgi:quinol monooxygenase YgiN
MACAFVFEAADVDETAYEQLMKGIGRESTDAPAPVGFSAHLAGPRPAGGWRVVDVWESDDAANAFYQSPTFGEVVMGAGLDIEVTPWPLRRVEIDQTLRARG